MTQKRKNRSQNPKNDGGDLQALLIQALRVLVVLGERGIVMAESLADKRSFARTHPYLKEAIDNIKNVIFFLKGSLTVEKKEPKKDERRKRKKGHQKISKQKTL